MTGTAAAATTKDLEVEYKAIYDGLEVCKKVCKKSGSDSADAHEMAVKVTNDVADALEAVKEIKTVTDRVSDLEGLLALVNTSQKSDSIYTGPDLINYNTSFQEFCRTKKAIPPEIELKALEFDVKARFPYASPEKVVECAKAMTSGSGPDGGYMILAERLTARIIRDFETSPVRSLVNMISTNTNRVEMIIDDDEAECLWVGEVSPRPETKTPQLGLKTIAIKDIIAQPTVTQNMLDDAGFDFEGFLAEKVAVQTSRKENKAAVIGNNTFEIRGFTTYPNVSVPGEYERDTVEQINSGVNGSFTSDSFIQIQNSLHEPFQVNASWAMQRATFTEVLKQTSSQKEYLLKAFMFGVGTDKVLLGRPVTFMHDMPAIATDSLAVAYADWRQFYTIIDRFGIRTIRDMITEPGFIKFNTTKRVGGDVTNFQAGKLLKLAA